MKTKILFAIFIAILVSFSYVFSQDIVDPPKIFDTTSTVYDHRQNGFTIGYNWAGPGRNLDYALSATAYHTGIFCSSEMADSTKWIAVLADRFTDKQFPGRGTNNALNGMSLFLEPTYIVDTTDNNVIRWNDVNGGVYGFKYHNWHVGDTVSSGNDFSRFLLRKDSIPINTFAVVLDSIYDGSILRYEDYLDINYQSNIINSITSTFFGINKLYFKNNACIFNYYFITCNFDFYIL